MTAVVTLIFGLIGKHAFDFYRKIRAGAYIEGINVVLPYKDCLLGLPINGWISVLLPESP